MVNLEPEKRLVSNYLEPGNLCHVAVNRIPDKLPAVGHYHDYYEVFFIRRGGCRHIVNDSEQALSPGDLIFIRPQDIHRFQATLPDSTLVNITLPIEYVNTLQSRYEHTLGLNCFWHKETEPAVHGLSADLVEGLFCATQTLAYAQNDSLLLDFTMLQLMLLIYPAPTTVNDDSPDWLRRALRKAKEPALFCKGAAGLVEAAGRGHEHVCRTTKRFLGKTPSEIVNEYRCEFAAQHLVNESTRIDELSEICGFNSPSHFFRLFKRHFGHTPRQYRIAKQQSVI